MIRLLLIDDHEMVRAGCRHVVSTASDIEIVGEAGSSEEALPLVRTLVPDVVLMDLHLPGASGLQATEHLAATQPRVRVIVLTMIDELPMPQRLLQAGAWGYLTKHAPAEELLRAIREVHGGRRYLSAEVATKLALNTVRSGGKDSPVAMLTPRELEIGLCLARGESNKQIARKLHISEKTVSTHKTRILEKLEVSSVVALANLLAHYRLLTPTTLESSAAEAPVQSRFGNPP